MYETSSTAEILTALNITHADLDVEVIDYIMQERAADYDKMNAAVETRVLYAAVQMGWK